jgi:hypothetical protein
MNRPKRMRVPEFRRLSEPAPASPPRQPLPISSAEVARHEFATRVVRRLVDSQARIAVIDDRGSPALVDCAERLFDVLSKDHPIVGVYAEGARVPDVIDDLKAAGL